MPDRASFATVSSVDPGDRASWDGKLLLTFDIDWAHDAVLADAIDLVEAAGVAATWFVTHETPLLARLRANPLFELGIHPNFLPLLMKGDRKAGADAEDVVDRMLAIVPEAKSIRSHSLVQSGRLLQIFRARGLTHDCNAFIPEQSGIELKPWVDWFGMVRVPYFWEDDFWCETQGNEPPEALLARPGLHAFDFHPIHLYLNTESMSRYEGARDSFSAPERLIGHRCAGRGTRAYLSTLLEQVR
ncbi:MAG TPA: hypothetical protein VGC35_06660 [Allosphingosinicella sp.]|jgi:hypothetical protein